MRVDIVDRQNIASCPCFFCSFRLKCNPKIALYITRLNRNTWLISSSLGTRPSSSWRATAILALRRRFFCSGVTVIEKLYQNPSHLSIGDTLIMIWDFDTFSDIPCRTTGSAGGLPGGCNKNEGL